MLMISESLLGDCERAHRIPRVQNGRRCLKQCQNIFADVLLIDRDFVDDNFSILLLTDHWRGFLTSGVETCKDPPVVYSRWVLDVDDI
jgi:hypothetical protein